MDDMLMKKFGIKKYYTIIILNPDEVQIRLGTWGGAIVTLFDDKRTGKLVKFISLLDYEHSVKQIISILGEDWVEDMNKIITHLSQLGIIEATSTENKKVALSKDEMGKYKSILSYFNLITYEPEVYIKALQEAKIAIIGNGIIGSTIALQLAKIGVGHISLVDERKITEHDAQLSTHFLTNMVGLKRAEIIKQKVVEVNSEIKCDVFGNNISRDKLEIIMKDKNLTILAEDAPSIKLSEIINDIALKNGNIWSIITMDGVDGVVGPTFIPHQTPCFKCLEIRKIPNVPHYSQYLSYYDASLKDSILHKGEFIGLPSYADILAGFFVIDVPHIITKQKGHTIGKLLTINISSMEIEVNTVIKYPRCPKCGNMGREKVSYNLYNTIDTILREVKLEEVNDDNHRET